MKAEVFVDDGLGVKTRIANNRYEAKKIVEKRLREFIEEDYKSLSIRILKREKVKNAEVQNSLEEDD